MGEDLIVRYIAPDISPSAQLLGSISQINNCEPAVKFLQDTSPKGSGYCTEVARAADNPGYNADADPAPPLRKLIAAFGGGC